MANLSLTRQLSDPLLYGGLELMQKNGCPAGLSFTDSLVIPQVSFLKWIKMRIQSGKHMKHVGTENIKGR